MTGVISTDGTFPTSPALPGRTYTDKFLVDEQFRMIISPLGGGGGGGDDPTALKIASNLSDLNNAATARTNLGLSIQVYSGVTPPAAPDDPTKAALFYPKLSTGGAWLGWDIDTQAWG